MDPRRVRARDSSGSRSALKPFRGKDPPRTRDLRIPRVDGDDLAVELYASGMSMTEVGDYLGISRQAVGRRLKLAGVQSRQQPIPGWSQYRRSDQGASRSHTHQWREVLTDALNRSPGINVRATVMDYLRRTPTRAEITAARRAAHRLAARGDAEIVHVPRPESETGPGGPFLILARPGTKLSRRDLEALAGRGGDDARRSGRHFEPAAMAVDLAKSVELLTAAVQAIPDDQLDSTTVQRLAASVAASQENLAVVRRKLRAWRSPEDNDAKEPASSPPA